MSEHHRSNRRDKLLTVEFRRECEAINAPCWLCHQPIDYSIPSDTGQPASFQRDHYYPASTHPELYDDPSNFRPSHGGCNSSRGNGAPRPGLGVLAADPWQK